MAKESTREWRWGLLCHILCRDGTVIHVPERIQLWTKMSEIQSEIKLITMSWITIHSQSIVGQPFLQFSHYRTLSMQRSKFWTVTHSECAALSLSPTVLIVMCHILAVNSCRWLAVDKLHAGWHVNQNNDISSYFNNCKSSHMSLSEDTWEMSQQQNFVLWQIFKCCQIFFLTETFCLRPNLFLTSESFKIWYFLIHSFF